MRLSPAEVTKLALMEAPIPGVGPWNQVLLSQATVQFHFFGPWAEQLVAGRERIYLNHIWDTFAFHSECLSESTRARYAASCVQPGTMHAAFSYFGGLYSDADDNATFAKTPLTMPMLAMAGEKSLGSLIADFGKAVATNAQASIITDSGHWLMDENPDATMAALTAFIAGS